MTAVLDDHLFLAAMANRSPHLVRQRLAGSVPVTTGSWYYRLCRAVLGERGGVLSRALEASGREAEVRVVLRQLPPDRGEVVSMAEVGYRAAKVGARHGLNMAAAEALAVALTLEAPILVAAPDEGPRLRKACAAEGADYVPISV